MYDCILIHPKDNVVVALKEVHTGDVLSYIEEGEERTLVALNEIPIYHKIARENIGLGNKVVKYGELIGLATTSIRLGEHVHVHNITSTKKNEGEA